MKQHNQGPKSGSQIGTMLVLFYCHLLVPDTAPVRLRPFLEKKILEKFLKKNNFLRNSREIRQKKIEIQISFFFTFGILTTKKTKLASTVYFSQNNL
jgi:hypothetical protein